MTAARNRLGSRESTSGGDLSSAFGVSAASVLRGRPGEPACPSVRRIHEDTSAPATVAPHMPTTKEDEDDMPDSQGARSARRGVRITRIRDRRQLDALLLAAAITGPTGAQQFIDHIREHSEGAILLSLNTVHHELYRLKKDRLIRLAREQGRRRYLLTELGERGLMTRRREWHALSRGFDKVFEAADGDPG